jgi:perosamine synthetase
VTTVHTPALSLSSPDIGPAEIDAVMKVLQSRHLSLGPCVREFERSFAEYIGVGHAVAVSSGTAGLHLSVLGAGVGPGDEVITTPFTFVASANSIVYAGATPVFVDIDPRTMNMDGDAIEAAITPRTKAILPVHVFGLPADMDRISGIAARHGLKVVEDACEALGAEWRGRRAGGFGESAVFAFYPNKQMTTGEGGMIVTGSAELASLYRSLANQGRDDDSTWLRHVRLGYNYRMDELSAALGLAQLSRIEELLGARRQVGEWYGERLSTVRGVEAPALIVGDARRSWFVYVVVLDAAIDRDAVMQQLAAMGVPSRPYFTPVHTQSIYRERFGYGEGDFPVTEAIARSTLALPFHGRLSQSDVEFVVSALEVALLHVG